MVWEVLDAILRATTKLGQAGAEAAEGVVETDVGRGLKGVRKWREWDARGQGVEVDVTGKRNLYKEAMEGTLVCESSRLETSLVETSSTLTFFSSSPSRIPKSHLPHLRHPSRHHSWTFSSTSQPFPCHRLPRCHTHRSRFRSLLRCHSRSSPRPWSSWSDAHHRCALKK